MNAAGEFITVELPPVDVEAEAARAGRMMQAAALAGELTPAEFAEWCACAAAIIEHRQEETPNATAGKQTA